MYKSSTELGQAPQKLDPDRTPLKSGISPVIALVHLVTAFLNWKSFDTPTRLRSMSKADGAGGAGTGGVGAGGVGLWIVGWGKYGSVCGALVGMGVEGVDGAVGVPTSSSSLQGKNEKRLLMKFRTPPNQEISCRFREGLAPSKASSRSFIDCTTET